MDDAVHVEVEVVEDDAIIRALLCGGDDAWVSGHEPLVERRQYPHCSCNETGEDEN
jgi:hypothetical protein